MENMSLNEAQRDWFKGMSGVELAQTVPDAEKQRILLAMLRGKTDLAISREERLPRTMILRMGKEFRGLYKQALVAEEALGVAAVQTVVRLPQPVPEQMRPVETTFDNPQYVVPCSTSPDMFFPSPRGDAEPAREVCRGCLARIACLEAANKYEDDFGYQPDGVWAGMTPDERARMR